MTAVRQQVTPDTAVRLPVPGQRVDTARTGGLHIAVTAHGDGTATARVDLVPPGPAPVAVLTGPTERVAQIVRSLRSR